MSNMEQIKECPFCGGLPKGAFQEDSHYGVQCPKCKAIGPLSYKGYDAAILLWNAAANQIEAKDAEIAKQRAMMHSQDEALADAQDKRDKYYADWYAEHRRVESADKRQDALEAEIEQLRKERDEAIAKLDEANQQVEYWHNVYVDLNNAREDTYWRLTGELNKLEIQRDEARAWARKLYHDNQLKDGDIIRLCEELNAAEIP